MWHSQSAYFGKCPNNDVLVRAFLFNSPQICSDGNDAVCLSFSQSLYINIFHQIHGSHNTKRKLCHYENNGSIQQGSQVLMKTV